jgi:chromodomain-helicase-DNA-binding protein 7
VIIFDSDWNP